MVTEEQVLKAVYESGLHQYAPKGILITKWKDGINVEEPPHLSDELRQEY